MNTFGRIFRITSFGESHGKAIGVTIDGCPAGLKLDMEAIQAELDRRKPGQSRLTTQRRESDQFEVLSGLVDNTTSGAPICFIVPNEDQRSKDYKHIEQQFRPSHADYTYQSKYGLRDHRGGGRSSARETIARVIGGAVAKQFLSQVCGMKFQAFVSSAGQVDLKERVVFDEFPEGNCQMVRCPDPQTADLMVAAIDAARKSGDSLGGIISCAITSVPVGLGAPVFNKLNALLGYSMLGINAVKGFEIGSGFAGTKMRGSTHNDAFYTDESGKVRTKTNNSGGVQGGISNGEEIFFRVAFKPTSTIYKDQESINSEGEAVTLKGKGRHDPCVVPRAVPIVEAMAALVMADLWLLSKADRV